MMNRAAVTYPYDAAEAETSLWAKNLSVPPTAAQPLHRRSCRKCRRQDARAPRDHHIYRVRRRRGHGCSSDLRVHATVCTGV